MIKYLFFIFPILTFIITCPGQARIRLRKVKDAPKTCSIMKEDHLLSRPDKPVWSTEKHSVVVADDISLVNDLGQTVCTWARTDFNLLGDITKFRFYIDEYKEVIYPYMDKDTGFLVVKAPFKSCSLSEKINTANLEFPKCEKPKGHSRKKKKKSTV